MSTPHVPKPDQDMSRRDMSTTVRATASMATARRPFALFVLTERRVLVVDRALRIGRSIDCDLAVPNDEACSRVHLHIAPSGDGVLVSDLGSRNGTFVDGVRVDAPIIVSRGVLRFGDTVAVIARAHDDEPAEATDCPLVGGASLAKARRVISLTAPTDLPLLVAGETGAGKEVAARWIHLLGRHSGPLVAINCAALPESLLEAELFGHVKGAFTGAAQARRGLVAAAAGGTLFLDEVGELPLAVQAKLLRVLEDRIVRPIGADGSRDEPVDFRVVSATNVDLQAAVERGAFRADLFARLAAVTVQLPPLRARIDDLPMLIDHLLARAGARATIDADALEALARFHWPQNVRQLDYTLRRAVALSPAQITLEHLPDELRGHYRAQKPAAAPRARADITREQLEVVLREHNGNVRRVGQALGIPRSRLYRLLGKWLLDPVAFRTGTAPAQERDPS